MTIKISIITICLNAVKELPRTLQSITTQTYRPLELIAVDGGSTDGTLDVLSTSVPRPHLVISEPDRGIYDAMNKGIAAASGEYILFMNAGDAFANSGVVERVFSDPIIRTGMPKIISGRVQFSLDGELLDLFRPSRPGCEGPGLPHQATFVEAALHKQHLFDPRYRYAGDYELWRRLRSKGLYEVYYINEVVAIFTFGGMSTALEHDPKRYLERAYIDYLYTGRFSLMHMYSLAGKITARRLASWVLSKRWYYVLLRKWKIHGQRH